MTWGGRVKLGIGLIAVFALVAVLLLVFNQRNLQVTSSTASITAQSFPVGTDYGGIITKQYVQAGQRVHAGQKLFQLRSVQLQSLQEEQPKGKSQGSLLPAASSSAADGIATVSSTISGRVASVSVPQGAYAQTGSVVAKVYRSSDLYVRAKLQMSPVDYSRLKDDATADILLPNKRMLHGHVSHFSTSTVGSDALVSAKIECSSLHDQGDGGLIAPGTPVSAIVHLQDDGMFAGVNDAFGDFLRKIGL